MKRLFVVAALLIASSLTALGQPAKSLLNEFQMLDRLKAEGNFKTLLIALDKAGLTNTLKGTGPFTIFAPDDAAFAKLPPGVLDALMKNPAKLRRLLLYHVTAGKLSIKDLQGRRNKSITMMDNTKAEVMDDGVTKAKMHDNDLSPATSDSNAKMHDNDLSPALMVINKSARIVMADLRASNGMIHGIDTVMAPGTHWLAR